MHNPVTWQPPPVAQRYQPPQVQLAIDQMTLFIEQQPVTHYFTLTFARAVSAALARFRFLEWIDALEWFQRRPLGWLRADERRPSRWSGCGYPAVQLHYHGVLIGAPNLNVPQAEALWRELAGDADIRKYEQHEGAVPYCLKQVFAAFGDYELGGTKAFRMFTPHQMSAQTYQSAFG